MIESETALVKTNLGLDLAARIQAGDLQAEDEFCNIYQRGVRLMATTRTRDREAARDLTQEVLVAAVGALRKGKLRDAEKLGAFVSGIARNLVNNYLRSKMRRPESELESVPEPSADPVDGLELADMRRRIVQELKGCSPTDQEILLLTLVEGHSLLEVAERLRLSYDAVRQRRSRVIREITKKFARLSQH
jgi:RNA polymerase sigma factor (sigma-70 family)